MNFKSNETIWSQIIEYVKKKIFSGAFACGQRLPAIRDFAVTCRVNPNTVVRVYAQLEEEGTCGQRRAPLRRRCGARA